MIGKTGNTARYQDECEDDTMRGKLGGFSLKQCRDFFGFQDSKKKRPCIRCDKLFLSEHAGVRVCQNCKKRQGSSIQI